MTSCRSIDNETMVEHTDVSTCVQLCTTFITARKQLLSKMYQECVMCDIDIPKVTCF